MENNLNIFMNDKERVKEISAIGVFEEKITLWIIDYKKGILTKKDVLAITREVADCRNTPELIEEIKQRLS